MMKFKQNLHTHSTFCDGKNTIEEFTVEAIGKGFDSIGFSSHGYTEFDERYCMKRGSLGDYIAECHRVREKYADKIAVYVGLEQDIYSQKPDFDLDYIIGSVHYIEEGGKYIPIDQSAETIKKATREHFDGDIYAFVEKYYATVENVKKATDCDIIGHFDLVTIFSEHGELFDETHTRYVTAARRAIESLVAGNVIFEVNSGAVARGYREHPYPSERVLKMLADAGAKITFSSDCHNKSYLDFLYDEMASLAKRAGFKEAYRLSENGFVPFLIE